MKNKTIKHSLKFAVMILVSASFTLLSGCGKKDKNTNAITPGRTVYDPNCVNCYADGSLLGAALGFNGGSASSHNMQLGLILTGGAGVANSTYGYNGPVSASGVLRVNSNTLYCPIPVGDYSVETVTAGTWNGGTDIFSGLSLRALHINGTIVNFRVVYGFTKAVQPNLKDFQGYSYPYGLTAQIVVDSVSNYSCNGVGTLNQFFFSY